MTDAIALVCDEKQRITLESIRLLDPAADEILIRALWTGVSIGTEFALIRNKISWGPYPICTGYMAVGVVEKAGSAIDNFKPGDKVYYCHGNPFTLTDGRKVTPTGGAHASHVVMKPAGTHGAELLPPGTPEAEASMFVLPAVGLEGVDTANPRKGDHVLVYGTGLIGLGVVAFCSLRGCVVTACDIDAAARGRALAFGADHVLDPNHDDLHDHFQKINPPHGAADVVFEATGVPDCVLPAIRLTRMGGSFVWQGNYGVKAFPFHFMESHARRLTMHFPMDDGHQPSRRAVIKAMRTGALPWGKAITHRIVSAEAPAVFDAINQGDRQYAGVVIRWS